MKESKLDARDEALEDIQKKLTNFILQQTEQKQLRFYPGLVEENNDPEKLGRCKIRVFGEHSEDIPVGALPWASPDFNFIGSQLGSFIVPPLNSLVKVYFENSDTYRPFYTTKVMNKNSLDGFQDKNEDYPDTMIFFETDLGDLFKINRKTAEMIFRHSSGLQISINKDGEVDFTNIETGVGNVTITVKGNISLKSTNGNIDIEAPKGKIRLGGSTATQPVLNVPISDFSGSPHTIGQQIPGTPGATYIRP